MPRTYRKSDFGFRVLVFGFRVPVSGFEFEGSSKGSVVSGFVFEFSGSRFRVLGVGFRRASMVLVQGAAWRFWRLWCRVFERSACGRAATCESLTSLSLSLSLSRTLSLSLSLTHTHTHTQRGLATCARAATPLARSVEPTCADASRSSSGFRNWGFAFGGSGAGCRVWGVGCRV